MRRRAEGALVSKSVRTSALLAVGYGLARAVTANSYITAFGAEAGTSLGLVAQTSFSVVTNLVSAAVAAAMVMLVLRGCVPRRLGNVAVPDSGAAAGASRGRVDTVRLPGRPHLRGSIPFAVLVAAAVCLIAGYGAAALGLFASLGTGTGALTCAVIYAVGSVALTLAWFEPFALEPDVRVAVRGLVCGFIVQAAGFFALSCLAGWALFAAVALMLAMSCGIRRVLAADVRVCGAEGGDALPGSAACSDAVACARATFAQPGAAHSGAPTAQNGPKTTFSLFKTALSGLFSSLLCVFMLTSVVGFLHTSVIGGAFEPVVGAVPMAESLVLAAVLLAAVVLVSRRVPTTASVYRVLFPLMLVALSVLPFIPGAFGHYAGMVMVVCYNLVGMAFVLFLVETAQAAPVPQVALMGVYQAGTQLFTVVGMVLGMFVNGFEARAEASYATIIILVCIYLLAMVPAVLSRRQDKGGVHGSEAIPADKGAYAVSQAQEAGEAVPPVAEDALSAAVLADQDFEQQQEVRGRVGARVEEWALERGLTARESQVLVQLARGWSANAIAADLGIAQNTAWAHIKRIYVKLDVHSKQELIEYIEREVINREG